MDGDCSFVGQPLAEVLVLQQTNIGKLKDQRSRVGRRTKRTKLLLRIRFRVSKTNG